MLLGWDKDRMLSVGVLGVDMTITCQMSEVLCMQPSLEFGQVWTVHVHVGMAERRIRSK